MALQCSKNRGIACSKWQSASGCFQSQNDQTAISCGLWNKLIIVDLSHLANIGRPWAQPSETPTSPLFQAAGGSKCCGCSWFIRSEVRVGSWSCDQTHTPSPGYLLGYRRLMMADVHHELLNMAEPCLGSETPTVCICMSLTSKPVGRESQV